MIARALILINAGSSDLSSSRMITRLSVGLGKDTAGAVPGPGSNLHDVDQQSAPH